MKPAKIMIMLLALTSSMILVNAGTNSKHSRPTWGSIFSGWTQKLRRAGGAKFTRELRDAGDNAGIALMHRVHKTGNALASGVSKTYTGVCVATETSASLVSNLAKGTLNAGIVIGNAGVNAYDAGMDSLAGSSVTCVNPAWIEMKRTIKHVFVHSNNIHTVSVKVLDDNFPGLATNVTTILRHGSPDICGAWKHIHDAVHTVLLESNGSHPHYDTNAELANDFADAFLTDPSVRDHIQEDCNTDFDTSC
jgi:hypothetical protein